MGQSQEGKKAKYAGLVEDCCRKGWKSRYMLIKVSCRGFTGLSFIIDSGHYWAKQKEAAEVALAEEGGGGSMPLGHRLGLDQPQCGHLDEGGRCLKDLKHPETPGNISEDV